MKIRKIALAVTMCIGIGLQVIIPAGAMEARYGICPDCGSNVNVYTTTETNCHTYHCKDHVNCTVHETTTTTYRIKDCTGCSDYDKYVIDSQTVYNHLIG